MRHIIIELNFNLTIKCRYYGSENDIILYVIFYTAKVCV